MDPVRPNSACAKTLQGDRPALLPWIGGFALVAVVVVLADRATLPPEETLTREGGGIETMSMLGYILAVLAYLRVGPRPPFWPVPVLLLAMALREFDADKRFTSEGVLSTKILFYDTPIWEKTLAVGVWALLVTALAMLVRYRGRIFYDALRRGAPWAVSFVGGLLLAASSKTIDGLGRKLLSFGIEISADLDRNAGTLEELVEIFVPILFLAAILLRARVTESDRRRR